MAWKKAFGLFAILLLSTLLLGCLGTGQPAPTATPLATAEPTIVKATATPTPEPTAESTPTPAPTATTAPSTPGLAEVKSGIEAGANKFLEDRSADALLSLAKLTFAVRGLNQVTRDYYEGEVFAHVVENNASKNMKIKIRVQQLFPGEDYEKGYKPDGERLVAGRLMKYSSTTENKYFTSLYCHNSSFYAYLEYSTTSTIPIDDLFQELAQNCPA